MFDWSRGVMIVEEECRVVATGGTLTVDMSFEVDE